MIGDMFHDRVEYRYAIYTIEIYTSVNVRREIESDVFRAYRAGRETLIVLIYIFEGRGQLRLVLAERTIDLILLIGIIDLYCCLKGRDETRFSSIERVKTSESRSDLCDLTIASLLRLYARLGRGPTFIYD